MTEPKRLRLEPIWLLVFAAVAGVALAPDRLWARLTLREAAPQLTRAHLDEALALGTDYLLAAQRPEGNFIYEYDWKADEVRPGDGAVRQAGALWGLTLIYKDAPSPKLKAAIERGFKFYSKRIHPRGQSSYVRYDNSAMGRLGTLALVTLAHIEYLRAEGPELSQRASKRLNRRLDRLLRFIVAAQFKDKRWYDAYRHRDGQPVGGPSPYFDGEALLALVKAARYLGRDHLWPTIIAAADAGWRLNVVEPLAADSNSNTTKGYFQWSSMAFYEIATSGRADTARFAERVLTLADWMVHRHHTLFMSRNTAYAHEAFAHAYDLAIARGETARARTYHTVMDIGLQQLTEWQVGHSLATRWIIDASDAPAQALGGVQNSWMDPVLRIDVVQHQMHAVLLARRYVYKE